MHKDNKMPRRTLAAYMMHSKTEEYKQNIQKARMNIHQILSEDMYKPVLEYSGGKDSIVMVDLFMKEDDTVPVWNYHPGYAWSIKQLFRSPQIQCDIDKTLYTMDPVPKNTYTSNMPPLTEDGQCIDRNYRIQDYFDCLFEYMDDNGLNVEVLGIRGQESSTRRQRVKAPLVHVEKDRVVSFPISHLTTDDIWAYIVSNDIYYCRHYDKYAETYGYDKCRFTSHYNVNDLYTGGSYYFDKIMEV